MHEEDVTHTLERHTARQDEPARTEAPLLLGRYRIVEQCGSGGFGRVLMCWDTRLQRRVAIKVMPLRMGQPAGTAASTMQEALAEARTSSLLAHPNIVTVYDFESDDHYAYLVMEYVDGLTLTELLKRVEGGRLTYEECAHLLRSVADALQFAHDNGVLHLDLKPSNIMIDRAGTVKLGDFGMSTLASAAGYGGARGGTVGYMPPEQIQGMLVDERTDVFSLAVVLWLALTGKNPFQATSAEESLRLIRRGPAIDLTRQNLQLDQDIQLVLERCLQPDPADRPSSVDAVARQLVPLLGSPSAGRQSLRDLIDQAQDDESDEDSWTAHYKEHTPVAERYPWLPGLASRLLAAGTGIVVSWRIASVALAGDRNAILAAMAIVAAAGAAWPPAASVLVAGLLCYVVATAPISRATWAVVIVAALLLGAWWAGVGRREREGSTCLLLASCLGLPTAGMAPCGLALPPLAAAVTAALSWLLAWCLQAAAATGFDAQALAGALAAGTRATTWLAPLGCALGSSVASAIGHGRQGWRVYLGQCLGLATLLCFQAWAMRVENSGIWASPDIRLVAAEIFLSVVTCVASVLMGQPGASRKGTQS